MRKLTKEERILSDQRSKERLKEYRKKNEKRINEKSAQWRIDHPERVKASNKKWVERRKIIRICCLIVKGGVCSKCGYLFNGKNGAAFTFHHRNPKDKDFELSHNLKLSKLAEELEKCDLVCENCHKLIHFNGGI